MVDPIKVKPENRLSDEASTNEKETAYYQRLITENIRYIEKQCHRACGIYKKKAILIDPDTLFNEVLDRLKEDDFKVLKDFKNRSKLTTYGRHCLIRRNLDVK